ncbi:MAG: isochorismatase family protein [Candidatus Limnocylindrales bacterium]
MDPSAPARSGRSGRFDPRTALIVVDVQNDFADPAGSLAVAGAERVLAAVDELVAEASAAGALVAYTQDWHPAHTPHFAQDGGTWPVHCVAGTWGASFHPGLTVAGPVVRKGAHGEDGYSGFMMRDPISGETVPTGLASLLEGHGIVRLVVVGLATDYCVKASVLDGLSLGYAVRVPREAVAAVDLRPGDGDRALEEMELAGARLA